LIYFGSIQIITNHGGGIRINWWAPGPEEGPSANALNFRGMFPTLSEEGRRSRHA
jgi:hypothetical protein